LDAAAKCPHVYMCSTSHVCSSKVIGSPAHERVDFELTLGYQEP